MSRDAAAKNGSGWPRVVRLVLWVVMIALAVLAAAVFFDRGGDAASRGLGQAFGTLLACVAAAGIVALLLASRWRSWLWVAGLIAASPIVAVTGFAVFGLFEQAKHEQEAADMASGKDDFGSQPQLFAVAQAIARNDPEAIRTAARAVADLNAAGKDGKTLLYFAVDQALEDPLKVKAVEALLSLGINPNYNNGQINSFAMWRAVSGPIALLRVMLDAGGDPNGPDFRGNPIIFWNWELTFNTSDRPTRFHLLLERGADINSSYPATSEIIPGYTLAMARVNSGTLDATAYTDAVELLQRGADASRVAADGATLTKLVEKRADEYSEWKTAPPPEFQMLVSWMVEHELLSAPTGK